MDRLPFAYVAVTLVLAAIALGAWVFAFQYFRRRPRDLSPKDKALGFFIMGPFFPWLHSSLSARGYQLTKREIVGLLLIFVIALVIIIGSVIHGYAGT